MNQLKKQDKLRFWIAVGFTALVFAYILTRAFVTEFISDETAAYWYFVYRGWFWGNQMVWDAANHPLNSFIGHHLYNYFGDVPGIIRLGSVLSYLFYAYASYQFTGLFQQRRTRILGFIAMNSIPYLIEYFGYLRGYGLSMGLFLCSLWFLYSYINSLQLKHVVLAYLFGFLGFSANLTVLNSLMLTIGAVGLTHFYCFKSINWKQHVIVLLGTVFLARISWPLIKFGLNLKEKGALYYSSLDGIWDMTGKSLSRYVLFTDNDLLMYLFLIFIVFLIYSALKSLGSTSWREWVKNPDISLSYYFLGNLCAVLLMAIFLKVNYPEDRTGMYFVPLFLLLFISILDKLPYFNWLLLLAPISLVLNLSLHTSVYSPEERLTNAFYKKVKKELKPFETVSIYKTMFANWHYKESHQNGPLHFPHTTMRKGNEADVFIARSGVQATDSLMNPVLMRYYREFARDPMNDHVAYRRVLPLNETFFARKDSAFMESSGEFLELWNQPQIWNKPGDYKLRCSFHLTIPDKRQSTDFVVTTTDKNGQVVRYQAMALELSYQSKQLDATLNFSVILDNLTAEEKGIKVYLWNRKPGVVHSVRKCALKVYTLSSDNQ